MFISIREALFSGEEVDEWEPTTSEWIIAQDDDSWEWTPEFRATGRASDKNSEVIFRRFLSIESGNQVVARKDGYWVHSARKNDQIVKIWYNADLDVSLLHFKSSRPDGGKYAESIMEAVSAMSQEEVEQLLDRGHVSYAEFN